jgi:hypothetical protein
MRTEIEWNCTRCNKQFTLNAEQAARVRKDSTSNAYCSRACAGIEPAVGVCAYCDAEFHPTQAARKRIRDGGPAYCSFACYQGSRVLARCAFCHSGFTTTAWQRRKIRDGAPPMCAACKAEQPTKGGRREPSAVAG